MLVGNKPIGGSRVVERKAKRIVTGVAMVTLIVTGTGVSIASNASELGPSQANGAGETEVPITGPDLGRASQVALDHLGEGRVTGTEVGDEESYYEIEVTLADGSQIDVQLDEGFSVIGSDPDSRSDD